MPPLSAARLARRARTRRDLGDVDGAWQDFTRALEIDPACWTARAARAALAFDHALYADAAADWRLACRDRAHGSQDWHRFRIWLAESRLGHEAQAARELAGYLASAPRENDWTAATAAFLTGGQRKPAFLALADTPAKECEGRYWAGAKRLLRRDLAGGAAHLRAAAATELPRITEWRSARSDLRRLGG